VALAADGTGVVAWSRRQRIYTVSIDVGRGTVGRVARYTPPHGVRAVVVAAGPGGAATLAWHGALTVRHGHTVTSENEVLAARRPRAGAFGATQRLAVTTDYVRDVAIAADEDGATTVAWAQEHFGDDRSIGQNGVTSALRQAFAAPGDPAFGAARTLDPRGEYECSTPALAARDGAVAMAWDCLRRGRAIVRVAVGPAGAGAAPTTVDAVELGRHAFARIRAVSVGLDDDARLTAVYVRPDAPAAGQAIPPSTAKVLAVSGR
jgi:hypothetical protein